jgi:hypothetical protein
VIADDRMFPNLTQVSVNHASEVEAPTLRRVN